MDEETDGTALGCAENSGTRAGVAVAKLACASVPRYSGCRLIPWVCQPVEHDRDTGRRGSRSTTAVDHAHVAGFDDHEIVDRVPPHRVDRHDAVAEAADEPARARRDGADAALDPLRSTNNTDSALAFDVLFQPVHGAGVLQASSAGDD